MALSAVGSIGALAAVSGYAGAALSASGSVNGAGPELSAQRLPLGSARQVLMSNGTMLVYGSLTAANVGADAAGTAAALTGIGGLATLVLAGVPAGAGAGVITVSAYAAPATANAGQLWFQHA
jgi:hypothetical protein